MYAISCKASYGPFQSFPTLSAMPKFSYLEPFHNCDCGHCQVLDYSYSSNLPQSTADLTVYDRWGSRGSREGGREEGRAGSMEGGRDTLVDRGGRALDSTAATRYQ